MQWVKENLLKMYCVRNEIFFHKGMKRQRVKNGLRILFSSATPIYICICIYSVIVWLLHVKIPFLGLKSNVCGLVKAMVWILVKLYAEENPHMRKVEVCSISSKKIATESQTDLGLRSNNKKGYECWRHSPCVLLGNHLCTIWTDPIQVSHHWWQALSANDKDYDP